MKKMFWLGNVLFHVECVKYGDFWIDDKQGYRNHLPLAIIKTPDTQSNGVSTTLLVGPVQIRWCRLKKDSPAKTKYLALDNALTAIRTKNAGKESPEEDALLDQMDKAWYNLTDREQRLLSKIPAVETLRK